MISTKERIMLAALSLFARDGYKAVSVSAIAGELGFTKAALYKHFKSKRAIFDSIVGRMAQLDVEHAQEHGVPAGTAEEMAEAYRSTPVDNMVDFAKAQFRFWTEDDFASKFRRMLTLEQFRDPEMAGLYLQHLVSGPLGYTADLLEGLGVPNAGVEAARFYAPMFLLYSAYDAAEDKAAVLTQADAHLENARQELKERCRMENVIIRNETEADRRTVENLVRESFWNVYRPGCLEHFVLHRLRDDPAFVPELNFVMEKDGEIIGQNMFMHAVIRADDGREIPIMTMGPICITPELKRKGYGKRLLDYSLEKAKELGCGALCFEGNIRFYGKSGFTYASEFGIRYYGLPEDADASFFLCRELVPGYLDGVTGVYAPPEGYFCWEKEPEAFEAFDAQFPKKVKLKLPGQLV